MTLAETASFPSEHHPGMASFLEGYVEELGRALRTIDHAAIAEAARIVEDTIDRGGTIFAFGNGGSAAIANHLLCDFVKGLQTDTELRPRVASLSSPVELLLAIGNDVGFEEIFRFQASTACRPGDLIFAITSSGNSMNIINGLEWARENGVKTIVLTGFTGGGARTRADCCVHVSSNNYGVVEDAHQTTMHVIAQFIRQRRMRPDAVGTRVF